MIIQIDHVAMSSMNFEEHIKIMNSLNYKPQFIETGIKNLQIKRRLMKQFSEDHDLAVLTSSGNIGIELINHRHINIGNSYIVPIFENVPDDLTESLGRIRINDCIFTEARMKSIDVPIFIKEDANKNVFRFNKMVIRVVDFKKCIIFWECVGFKLLKIKKGFALLEFKSLVNKDVCQIYLQEYGSGNNKPYLDNRGFNCIAFISNSAKNEKEFLDNKGVETTEIEELILNQRVLDIFLARGPCGELIEIIGLEKG